MIVEAMLVGTRELMMSTQRGADPTDSLVRELSRLTKKKSSDFTVDEHEEIKWKKFLLNLHWSKEDGVFIPAVNVIKAVEEAARKDKKGKDVLRYVDPLKLVFPLLYEGPQDQRELFDAGFVDTRLANHGTRSQPRMVLETRPFFKEWGLSVGFSIDTDEIEVDDFKRWLEQCGKSYGLGAYRQLYGRFVVKSFQEKNLDD